MTCEKMEAVGSGCGKLADEGGAHGMGSWDKNPATQGYQAKMMDWLKQTMH